ncbi:MAG: DUF1080 domain-containing protein [Candidatus Sumerlaeota bacterium]|nr:DUF1080 domain-containing protein [Candidatus Sumerlaeota bacterium]
MNGAMAWLAGVACLASAAFAGEAASKPAAAAKPSEKGWKVLFDGQNMDAWNIQPGSWEIKDGAMAKTEKDKAYAWSKEEYGDFVLDLEFKNSPKTNSGVFIRTGNLKDPVQRGIEIQVLDSPGSEADKHSTGSIYDCLAPKKNLVKAPGEWNHMIITAKGPKMQVELNGEPIIDADLDQWKDAGMNPDGSKNKFKTALKDMPRKGFIGLQAHGTPIEYRNIKIKALD